MPKFFKKIQSKYPLRTVIASALLIVVLIGAFIIVSLNTSKEEKSNELPLQEGQDWYDALTKKSTSELWNAFRSEERGTEKMFFIESFLSEKLNAERESEVYNKISKVLADSKESLETKENLLVILGGAESLQALKILLDFRKVASDASLKESAATAIGKMGNSRYTGDFVEELSPLLEETWRNSEDITFFPTLASTLARVGAPSGVELLISDVRKIGNTIQYLEQWKNSTERFEKNDIENVKILSAAAALTKISNTHALSTLERGLGNQSPDNFELFISGAIMMNMGRPEATQAVLDWAYQREDNVSSLISLWFPEVRDLASLRVLMNAEEKRFVNQANKDAVQEVLERHYIAHSISEGEKTRIKQG